MGRVARAPTPTPSVKHAPMPSVTHVPTPGAGLGPAGVMSTCVRRTRSCGGWTQRASHRVSNLPRLAAHVHLVSARVSSALAARGCRDSFFAAAHATEHSGRARSPTLQLLHARDGVVERERRGCCPLRLARSLASRQARIGRLVRREGRRSRNPHASCCPRGAAPDKPPDPRTPPLHATPDAFAPKGSTPGAEAEQSRPYLVKSASSSSTAAS